MNTEREQWNAMAADATVRTASWLATLGLGIDDEGTDSAAPRSDLLEGARHDRDAFAFTRQLLEAVVGAGDPFAAALGLREASRDLPSSMPFIERLAVRAGGLASLGLPWAVLPMARKWLRDRVSHLVLSAKVPTEQKTQPQAQQLAVLRSEVRGAGIAGVQTLLAPGGTEVIGDRGVQQEVQRLRALIALPETTHVAVSVARLVPPNLAGAWSLDRDAEVGAAVLRELLLLALEHDTALMLEPHDYRTALLAPLMLVRAIEAPGLEAVRAGVTVLAELPESLLAVETLVALSRARVVAGGEPLEITVAGMQGAGREQIESILTGLAVAVLDDAAARDALWLRLLVLLLQAGDSVRAVAASEDVTLLATATLLAERAGAGHTLTLQLRAGSLPELEAAVAEHGFAVRRRLPLVSPDEFSGAIEYLIALSAEVVDEASPLARSRSLLAGESSALTQSEQQLHKAIGLLAEPAPVSQRVQQRAVEWHDSARETSAFYRSPAEHGRPDTGGLTAAVLGLTRSHTGAFTVEIAGELTRIPVVSSTGFANEPPTDACSFGNREWMRQALARARRSDIGMAAVAQAEIRGEDPEALFATALEAGEAWSALRGAERGARVARLALGVAATRDLLAEVLAAESGAPVHVLDTEVGNAVDAARYLGQLAAGLGVVRGAHFTPDRLTLVVADSGVPLGERAEAALAALAAGSPVVMLVHQSVARSTAVLLEQWLAAGLPASLVSLVVAGGESDPLAHSELAADLAADSRVARALVLGHRKTAEALLRRRPELKVEGRFRALGAVLVTSSADPVLAVRNVVASAFGAMHADASTARALVLLGPAARSTSLHLALADAVSSLVVGDTSRPGDGDPLAFTVGPLAQPPSEQGLRALTELGDGESWLVQPERLDDEGLLWRPGVRLGVGQHSSFWRDAVGMPVIGVIGAHTVDGAISLINKLGGGGVVGLQATDPSETLPWLEGVRAASLFVGRATTGGRIERQPGGGWDSAGMGAATLAGGPSRLMTLGSWQAREGTASSTLHLRGLAPEVRLLIEIAQASLDYQSFDRVRRAVLSDTLAWRTELGRVQDVSGLGVERNLLRRWPVATHVRLSEDASLGELVRVICAGFVARAPMAVSTGLVLPGELSEFLASQGVMVSLERDDAWLERLAVAGPDDEGFRASRVRLIGGDRARTAEWLGGFGEVSLWAEPVTMAGPVELLAFLREQSVSITAHRHGLAMLPTGVGGWIAELR